MTDAPRPLTVDDLERLTTKLEMREEGGDRYVDVYVDDLRALIRQARALAVLEDGQGEVRLPHADSRRVVLWRGEWEFAATAPTLLEAIEDAERKAKEAKL
jgi:hypothetical protein